MPFSVNVEQQMNLQLLSDVPSSGRGGGTERARYFFQSELKGLLRGDTAAQTAHILNMIDRGVYSQNDARDYLGQAPYEGGDRYWVNGAYVPIDRVDDVLDKRGPGTSIPAPGANATATFSGIFRDAIGRVMNRKDRSAAVYAVFSPIVSSVAQYVDPLTRFAEIQSDYLGALAQRARDWQDADAVVIAELERLIAAIIEKGRP